MGVLGRGLASLIPKRDPDNAEDMLEQIDSMEIEEEIVDDPAQPVEPQAPDQPMEARRRVNVVEDSEEGIEIEQEEELVMPSKPLVTPLPIDPEALQVMQEETVAEEQKNLSPPKSARAVHKRALKVEEDKAEEETEPSEESPETPAVPEEQAPVQVSKKQKEGDSWDKHEEKVVHVSVNEIHTNPFQPRRSFDPADMEELQDSIEQHGILQPLVVRRDPDGGYELIAGERRLRAAKALKWERVPCVVRMNVKSDDSRLVFALIENIQRENLNPIEEALAYKKLNVEYGLSHEEIGQRVGQSRVTITNILRFLQLPDVIQQGLEEGKITPGHAKAILMIPDAEKQLRFYEHMLAEGLTVRKAEVRARRIQKSMNLNDPLRRNNRRDRHYLADKFSPALEQRYGFDATVKFDVSKNYYQIIFKAHNEPEIHQLFERLMGTEELPKNMDKDIMES